MFTNFFIVILSLLYGLFYQENLSASEITMEHLRVGIQQVQPSDVRVYEKLSTKFQRLVHSTAKEDDLGGTLFSNKPIQNSLWYASYPFCDIFK